MLPDLVNMALAGSIKKVTNVRTIADAFIQSEIYQSMLCEINKIILLFLLPQQQPNNHFQVYVGWKHVYVILWVPAG